MASRTHRSAKPSPPCAVGSHPTTARCGGCVAAATAACQTVCGSRRRVPGVSMQAEVCVYVCKCCGGCRPRELSRSSRAALRQPVWLRSSGCEICRRTGTTCATVRGRLRAAQVRRSQQKMAATCRPLPPQPLVPCRRAMCVSTWPAVAHKGCAQVSGSLLARPESHASGALHCGRAGGGWMPQASSWVLRGASCLVPAAWGARACVVCHSA